MAKLRNAAFSYASVDRSKGFNMPFRFDVDPTREEDLEDDDVTFKLRAPFTALENRRSGLLVILETSSTSA